MLFGGYSYDGVSAAIGVQHTEVPNLGASWSRFLMVTEAHLFSLPNDCLWYDMLWGPSQRVVTLFVLFPLYKLSLSFSTGVWWSRLVSSSLAPFPRPCRHLLLQARCHHHSSEDRQESVRQRSDFQIKM